MELGSNFSPWCFAVLVFVLFIISGTVVPVSSSAAAETPASPKAAEIKPVIDPEADKLLRAMSAVLARAKAFTVSADVDFDRLMPSGLLIKYGGAVDLTVERPGKAYASFDGDLQSRKIWYTGSEITVLDADNGFYGALPTPGTIDETMDFLISDYGMTIPLADILSADPYKAFISNAVAGVVAGESTIDNKSCTHLAFVQKYIDWQIWISDGADRLPCKLVINYKTVPGSPQYSAEFSHWSIDPSIDPSVFKPEIPPGAMKIDFLKMQEKNKQEGL
ncbi:MAG TPA: DUF2092 domain-containing protein [Thermodesulfobacteriota bacterium]|nr:DUF2092 domain-containing protein [Thermodesulfobacteriota bacterium]